MNRFQEKTGASPRGHYKGRYENNSDYPCTGEPPQRVTALVVKASPTASTDLECGDHITVELYRQRIEAVDFYSTSDGGPA